MSKTTAAGKKQRSVNDAWNLFSIISSIIGTAVAVNVGVDAEIAKLNHNFGLHLASPTDHGLVSHVSSSQAVTGFEAAAIAGGVMGAFCSSSALHDYLIAEEQDHLKAIMNFVQYAGSVLLVGAGIAVLAGAAGFVLVKIMPFVIMALVAANVLYNLGLMFVNLYRAVTDEKNRKEHLKAALNSFVSLILNALIILSVVLFLGPLFAALKAAVTGNAKPLAAVFSNPLQVLLASTFVATAVAAISKTLVGSKAAIADAWKDPLTALCNLFENDKKAWNKIIETFGENNVKAKVKALAYAVVAVAILPARIALLALKAIALLLICAAKKFCSAKLEKASAPSGPASPLTGPASPSVFAPAAANQDQIQGQDGRFSPASEERSQRPRANSLPGIRELQAEPVSPQPAPVKRRRRLGASR